MFKHQFSQKQNSVPVPLSLFLGKFTKYSVCACCSKVWIPSQLVSRTLKTNKWMEFPIKIIPWMYTFYSNYPKIITTVRFIWLLGEILSFPKQFSVLEAYHQKWPHKRYDPYIHKSTTPKCFNWMCPWVRHSE